MDVDTVYERAANAIKSCQAMVITAGAGMGVDSGLPDFRGDQGFWNAYPMYERLNLSFVEAANPVHFQSDPPFGWGFYGHRLGLYRETVPHEGFKLLLDWCDEFDLDSFVVTSNVDGQFQKAGFNPNRIFEIHGSIHHLQCLSPCSDNIWKNKEVVGIDYERMRAENVPTCSDCGGVARPNILMFGDYSWVSDRTDDQSARFNYFMSEHENDQIVVIEMGAGTAVPSIRFTSERIGTAYDATVVRINPRESQIGHGHISIPEGALFGLYQMNEALMKL